MTKATIRLVVSSLFLGRVGASVCDIVKCLNGGVCVDEDPDFSDHHFVDNSGLHGRGGGAFHCECDPEWTGRLCEVPYDRCSDPHIC